MGVVSRVSPAAPRVCVPRDARGMHRYQRVPVWYPPAGTADGGDVPPWKARRHGTRQRPCRPAISSISATQAERYARFSMMLPHAAHTAGVPRHSVSRYANAFMFSPWSHAFGVFLHVVRTGRTLGIDVEHEEAVISVEARNALGGLQGRIEPVRLGSGRD